MQETQAGDAVSFLGLGRSPEGNIPGSYAILFVQHQTLLLSPVPSATGCCFCLGSISSFFLEFYTTPSGVPRDASQLQSIPDFSEAP